MGTTPVSTRLLIPFSAMLDLDPVITTVQRSALTLVIKTVLVPVLAPVIITPVPDSSYCSGFNEILGLG